MSKGLTLLEEEQSGRLEDDIAVNTGSGTADDSAATTVSKSPVSSQQTCTSSSSSSGVVRRDSSTDDVSRSTDVQSVSSASSSLDLVDADPWLPLSARCYDSQVHGYARNALVTARFPCSCHLQCCNGAASTLPHPDSHMHCRLEDGRLQKTWSGADDAETHQHNLGEIKEGMPVSCFDGERTSPAHCVHRSSTQSDVHHTPNTQLSSPGARPVRKASLNGLRKAVKSVLVHKTSPTPEQPLTLADIDRCRSPFENSSSVFSDQLSTPEKCSRSAGSKRLSKFERHHYFSGGHRGRRGGGVGVDSVRQSLSHLLRTGDHGSNVVGERMAAGCLERQVSNTLTLTETRKTSRPPVLSCHFDETEAAENFVVQSETSPTPPGTDDQSDNDDSEFDGLSTTTTELDTSDSFYESRLFDALEAQENINGDSCGGGGGFDTDSSDDGTYSADSLSDEPTSTASSDQSVEVDCATEPRQCDQAETHNSDGRDDHQAPVVTSHALHRTTSESDVEEPHRRTTADRRCSLTAFYRLEGVIDFTDSSLPRKRWKRLSL